MINGSKLEFVVSDVKSKSILYYLLPAFFAIIGGIIAMIILRKSDPKKGRNCVIVGIISSGFSIGMDYVNDIYNLPIMSNYINTFGIADFVGGTSIYVIPPIVIAYYVIDKMRKQN